MTADPGTGSQTNSAKAPHPGTKEMPRWNVGELVDAPVFDWRKWFSMLGPGLLLGGSAIGGGEWLMGPTVTARYGGALMWLATLSILGQVVYNIEISRYALYTGEPIFTGKFRTLPGPMFWVFVYLCLDFGAIFPYLAANAATPVAAIWLGDIPDSTNPQHQVLLKGIGYGIFLLAFLPLIFGGKVYNSLKAVMTFKIFVVLGFLVVLGFFYTQPATWAEIFSGFVKFGNVPVRAAEDRNGNGTLDPGEDDWDADGRADVVEPEFTLSLDTDGDGKRDAFDVNRDDRPDEFLELERARRELSLLAPDFDGDGEPDNGVHVDTDGDDKADLAVDLQIEPGDRQIAFVGIDTTGTGTADLLFLDFDGDRTRDGDGIKNVFVSLIQGEGLPDVDLSMIAFLAAFAAIAGSGGLSNAPISNYTRDQGWGMGHHVGAIPSMIGGRDIQLSHVGTVFIPTAETLPRWKRWYRHVLRDQLVVWMPACFLGIALPSLLSVEFLKRGTVANQWTSAGMTADGVFEKVASVSGLTLASGFWFMTLFCGFLVLAPSMAASIDGFCRRWVDVFWTGSRTLRQLDPKQIKYVYFAVLCGFCLLGLTLLTINRPLQLIRIATIFFNFALGFSCWHTMVLNHVLLPKAIRPGWFVTICLFLSGVFFWLLASISALKQLGYI